MSAVLVMSCLLGSLLLGLLLRAPCTRGNWSSGLQYRRFCYTDILALYQSRALADKRIPYLQAPNEYPVGTGLFMAVTAWPVDDAPDYFRLNVLALSACAAITVWLLYLVRGSKALFFAAAPSLALGSFINWDLLVVAMATAATVAFLRRRDSVAGILLGLGAATKLYPALLLVPFVWQRVHDGERDRAVRLALTAAGTWLMLNLPFALFAFDRWSYFFRFNSARPPEWASPWAAACRTVTGQVLCPNVAAVNVLSTTAFAVGVLLTWLRWRARGNQGRRAQPWTFAFALVVLFLLTSKVYSPQYSLWLLPWFAFVFPDLRVFLAFQAADAAVFLTRFSWEGRFLGFGGVPFWMLETAVILRAAVLLMMVLLYLRPRGPKDQEPAVSTQSLTKISPSASS